MILAYILLLQVISACNIEGQWYNYTSDTNNAYLINSNNIDNQIEIMALTENSLFGSGIGLLDSNNNIMIDFDYWFKFTGQVKENCMQIQFDDGHVWKRVPNVKKVHVVFMNHLDVGYNGIPAVGFINNVLNTYFHGHFPRALALIDTISKLQLKESFIYTTHSWLVSLYLNCPKDLILSNIKLKCPSSKDQQRFISAIKSGQITWHAGPFNVQFENMDSSLFEYGISIGKNLDEQFGIKRPTLVLSQRDVPGMTRGVIPLLKKQGVSAITVGENQGAVPVAEKLFLWKDVQSNSSIIAMWHPHGYGGINFKDCVISNGHALAFAFRTDNSGPVASVQELKNVFSQLQSQYPFAEVVASTYENFVAEAVLPIVDSLPVIEQEVGDIWIQGVSSDPYKMSLFRLMSRERTKCLNSRVCDLSDPRIENFSRFLIKIPEHTWGLPSLNDNQNWSNELFENARKSGENYKNCENAWKEQVEFNYLALNALENHTLATTIKNLLPTLEPSIPNITGFTNLSDNVEQQLTCGQITIQFDKTGAIVHFQNSKNIFVKGSKFASFEYITLNESDFIYMQDVYGSNAGYDKPNTTCKEELCPNPIDFRWYGNLKSLYMKRDSDCTIVQEIQMPSITVKKYGAPQKLFVEMKISQNELRIILNMFNKTSTRLPEQLFYSFYQSGKWQMNKLNSLISPSDVIINGSQYQHAVWDGVYVFNDAYQLNISTLDAPLVSPITNQQPIPGWFGTPTAMPVPLKPLVDKDIIGMSYNLYNNVWNTNYILYYPYQDNQKNSRFRFTINF